jgi:hypothetical protein
MTQAPESRDNLSWSGAINHADALVAQRQTGLQERNQDLIPFHLAREHPADVIARLGLEPPEPQGNTVRQRITTNRKRLFEIGGFPQSRADQSPYPDEAAGLSTATGIRPAGGTRKLTIFWLSWFVGPGGDAVEVSVFEPVGVAFGGDGRGAEAGCGPGP